MIAAGKPARRWNAKWTAGSVLLLLVLSVLALMIGRYTIALADIAKALFPFATDADTLPKTVSTVIYNIRLPRILLSLIAGAGLAVSGAAFQGLFANPLATPDTLGVATGASFGAVLGILWSFSGIGIQLLSMAFGVAAVALAFAVSRTRAGASVLMIVLSGLVIGSLFSALVSLVKYVADSQDVLPNITYWLMGSMASTTKTNLYLGAPSILLGTILIFLLRWKLNALSLSEEEARSLGVHVRLLRTLIILSAALVTSAVVSMCGQIGWVGLLIPHIARMIFGNDNRSVVPASIAFGALFMLVVDTLARTVTAAEIPVSILTAVIGAPFFILLLKKTGGILR